MPVSVYVYIYMYLYLYMISTGVPSDIPSVGVPNVGLSLTWDVQHTSKAERRATSQLAACGLGSKVSSKISSKRHRS